MSIILMTAPQPLPGIDPLVPTRMSATKRASRATGTSTLSTRAGSPEQLRTIAQPSAPSRMPDRVQSGSDQFAALAAQVGPLGGVLGGGDRGVVRLLGLVAPTEPAQQV